MRSAHKIATVALAGGLLALTGCTGAAGGDGDAAQTVTLTLGHPFADTHHIAEEVLKPFAEAVAKDSNGTVNIDIVSGGALGAGDVVYENVVSGAQDMGFSIQGYSAGRFPLTEVVGLPFLAASSEEATGLFWDIYEEFPELQAEYEDVKVLGLFTADVEQLFTSDAPVESKEDLSGLNIRAAGTVPLQLLNKLGGSGVLLSGADIYDGLDRGLIDGTMVAAAGVDTLNLDEVAGYGTICNCGVTPNFVVMNKQTWEGLSADQQEAIDNNAGQLLSLKAAESYDAAAKRGYDAAEAGNMVISELDDAEYARWSKIGDELIAEWVETRQDPAVAEKIVKFARDTIN